MFMYHTARWLVAACLLAGCSASREEMRGSAGGENALTVALRVDVSAADGSERELKPSELLHTGDKIALNIEVDQSASLYVAQGVGDGKLDLLFSQTGEQKVMPKQGLRIPSQGQWLEPEGNAPEESLFVVASTRPFAQLERELCTSLKRLPCSLAHDDSRTDTRGGGAKSPLPPPPPPPPPPNIDIATRSPAGKGYTLVARSDNRGVAVLQFVLRRQR